MTTMEINDVRYVESAKKGFIVRGRRGYAAIRICGDRQYAVERNECRSKYSTIYHSDKSLIALAQHGWYWKSYDRAVQALDGANLSARVADADADAEYA